MKYERKSLELEELAYTLTSEGQRLEDVAKAMGFAKTGHLARYRKKFPEFDALLTEAIVTYCEFLEEQLLHIPHMYSADTARLLSNNIIKLLEFRNPKRYSPRHNVDMNINIDISGALDRANQRLIDLTPALPVFPLLENKDPEQN